MRKATFSVMIFVLGITIAAGTGTQLFAKAPNRNETAESPTKISHTTTVENIGLVAGVSDAETQTEPSVQLALLTADTASSSDEEQSPATNNSDGEAQIAEAAEATLSFWRIAWNKSWPFLHVIGKGLWQVMTAMWQNMAEMITIEPIDSADTDAPNNDDVPIGDDVTWTWSYAAV